jgi:alcohol dehydrogenase, propanol-preferring
MPRFATLRQPSPVASRPLHLEQRTEPEPGPGEVLLEVAACGVCRTDLQLVEGDLPARALPVVPGHQIVGRVRSVGEGVEIGEGTRVGVAWLARTCGQCDQCERGRENLCRDAAFTGWDRDGGFADVVTADHRFLHPLPEQFDDAEAAPLLCGGAIGYRSLRVSGIEPGQRLGLYGFGASATIAIQVAVHEGCEVYVCTRSPNERRRALDLGAVWAGGYDDVPPAPLHAAISFAPVGEVVVAALSALDRGGTVVVNAIHLDRIPTFDYDLLWWERAVRSVANLTRADVRDLLALAVEIPIRPTLRDYPLASLNEALADLAGGALPGAAVVVP